MTKTALPDDWDLKFCYPPLWGLIPASAQGDGCMSSLGLFASESEAREKAASLNTDMGYVEDYRHRYVPQMATVLDREECAQYSATDAEPYHPEWQDRDFWRHARRTGGLLRLHHTRVVPGDRTMLSYYPDERKACLGQRVPIKPGRYLTKFFGDKLSPKQIKALVEWQVSGSYVDPEFGGCELKFAHTPDEIEEVYTTGPASCMSHDVDGFRSRVHPARVYGAGDLAVAYIEAVLPRRDILKPIARALCWPERKVFGRLYPNTESYGRDGFDTEEQARAAKDTLEALLRREGYMRYDEHAEGGLCGAKLLRIEHDDRAVVLPYVDNYSVTDCGHYLRLDSSGDWEADTTNGLWYVNSSDGTPENDRDDYTTCDNCNDECDAYGTFAVYTSVSHNGFGRRTQSWCQYCSENHAWRCEATDATFSEDVSSVETVEGQTVTEAYAESHYTRCERCENFTSNDRRSVQVDGQEELWCEQCADEHTFCCQVTGRNHPNGEEHEAYDEIWCGVPKEDLRQWLVKGDFLEEGEEPEMDSRAEAMWEAAERRRLADAQPELPLAQAEPEAIPDVVMRWVHKVFNPHWPGAVFYYSEGHSYCWQRDFANAKRFAVKPDEVLVPTLDRDYVRYWLLVPADAVSETEAVTIETVNQMELV